MNLCLYTATFLPTIGGAELVLHELATQLTGLGHRITVLAPSVRHADNRLAAAYRVRRYQRPSSKRFGVRQVLLYLLHEYWRRPFEVLLCHGAYPPAYVGATFKRWCRVPLVVRPHGADVLPGEYIRAHPRLAGRLRRALAAADLVIAQSAFLQREILALGVSPLKVRLIPNGVHVADFQRDLPESPFPDPYALAVGSFSRKKGFDVLLRAFASLAHEVPGLHLVIAGAGRELPAYTAFVQAAGLQARVHFVGIVQGAQKARFYRHCRFFVCPSRREPFATVNLEALAAGKPIVATAVGGNVEVVVDGVNGFLVPADEPAALAAAMRRLLREPTLAERMGRQSAQRARRYDWACIVPQYVAAFAEAAALYGRAYGQRPRGER
jgi:glycosyltransferase involved in cell wall biosynthesis